MIKLLTALLIALLTGCASYTLKGETCEVSILSTRFVADVNFSIDKNCKLTATAAKIDSSTIINEAIKRIPTK